MKITEEQSRSLGGCAPCQLTPMAKQPGAGGGGGDQPKSVVIVDPTKEGWIGIELVDTAKKPVPNEEYVVTLVNGEKVPGTLDQNGKTRIEGIDPGQCSVTFPKIDRRDFV
jgi:hypothetical protein